MPTPTGEKTSSERSMEHGEECCKLANQRFHLQQQLAAAQQQVLEQQAVIKSQHDEIANLCGHSSAEELHSDLKLDALQQHVNAEKVKMLEEFNNCKNMAEFFALIESMIAELSKEN
jgi:hypothetical protein